MQEDRKIYTGMSVQTYKRAPAYLDYLKQLQKDGCEAVSAAKAAAHFGFTTIQVRKDFAAICPTGGKPRAGFDLHCLIEHMEDCLGFRNVSEAVLVGVGSMGHALLTYEGFQAYGLRIIAAFDSDTSKIGSEVGGTKILDASTIAAMCQRLNIHIGIITVPSVQAQTVCDSLTAGGVKALWNFAPVQLTVPQGVLVQNENMALSLAMLSKHLRESMQNK